MDTAVVKHLETHLGTIQHGWSVDAEGFPVSFQVVELGREKEPTVKQFATLGLSNFPLISRVSGKAISCELVMVARNGSGAIPGVMQQIGRELVQQGNALLRGDVIGPRGLLVAGSQLAALYASIPTWFPDSFASCTTGSGTVVFVWLIPISCEEADFIRQNGWNVFEETLQQCDPDLSDLLRASTVSA